MRKVLFIFLTYISLQGYGQIIADHTVVDKFDDIPQYYIDQVKKMWLVIAGESHSRGYFHGLELLEALNSTYQVNWTQSGTPQANTTSHLRTSRGTWGDVDTPTGWVYLYGEEDWWTTPEAKAQTKTGITYCHDNNLEISVFGFGHCYDDGVNYSDYINATQEYIDYCQTKGYNTKIIFTTVPVDDISGMDQVGRANGAKLIRDYIALDPTRILFDYSDILCYNNDGSGPRLVTTYGYTIPVATINNMIPEAALHYHISEVGALRLGKALWWMLARIAGWDGSASLGIVENQNNKEYIKKIVTHDKIELQLDEHHSMWSAGLYDFQGTEIIKKPVGSDLLTFDISMLSSGIYFIVLSNGRERLVEKAIKP